MNRRTLLLTLTALMAVSGLVVALAQNHPGLHDRPCADRRSDRRLWSLSAATAMRLVPELIPRALAIFNSGNALQRSLRRHWAAFRQHDRMARRIPVFAGGSCRPGLAVGLSLSMERRKRRSHKAKCPVAAATRGGTRHDGLRCVLHGSLPCSPCVVPGAVTHAGVPVRGFCWRSSGGFVGTLPWGIHQAGLYRTLVIVPALMALTAVLWFHSGSHLGRPPHCSRRGVCWPPPHRSGGGAGWRAPSPTTPRPAAGPMVAVVLHRAGRHPSADCCSTAWLCQYVPGQCGHPVACRAACLRHCG